jgi:transposase
MVLRAVRGEEVCRRLMTVPGVGPVASLAFRATVDRAERFARSRDVGAHLGQTPRRYQSGETDRSGAIAKTGDALARHALYEAATSMLVHATRPSALRSWAVAVAKRRGLQRGDRRLDLPPDHLAATADGAERGGRQREHAKSWGAHEVGPLRLGSGSWG